jgi:glycosyltransferase involved in cell wall biosynthesis
MLNFRMDTLPQTAIEAQSCGVPVVGFNATGLPDVVQHQHTGYLAAPCDSAALAHGISWVLEEDERRRRLGAMARLRAEHLWHPAVIAQHYVDLYQVVAQQAQTAVDG